MSVGPRWFGGVFLAEFTCSRPQRETLFAMCSCQFCFSHVPQRGAVGKSDVLIRESICEAAPSSLSDLHSVPKDGAGMCLM